MEDIKNVQWPGWEVVRLIGRGSFGAVYEIQRDLFGKKEKAALKHIGLPQNESDVKELRSDGYDEESITATFQSYMQSIVNEYSLMRKLNGSSNVVNCDDVQYIQWSDGIGWDIYIKMELVTPLTDALPSQIPERTVVQVAKDLCHALVLCQKHQIIHRDIKPQNIFVSDNGDYKLGDFGIAKTVEKTMGGTKTGTYKYMAPEVYHNQPYGHQADIYSLGLVLYWMLNKKRMPFMPLPPAKLGAGMDEQTRNRRLSGEQIPPPADGSAELKRIVLKACAYDPKERYQTAEEMLEDLEAIGSGKAPRKETPAETGPAFFPADRPEPEQSQDATVGAFRGYDRPEERQAAPEPVKDYAAEEGTVGAFGRRENAVIRPEAAVDVAETIAESVEEKFSRMDEQMTDASDEVLTVDASHKKQKACKTINNEQGNVRTAPEPGRNTDSNVLLQSSDVKAEEKKKRGIGAWIAIAAGLVVFVCGLLLLLHDKDETLPGSSTERIAATTAKEPKGTLPVQLDWATWVDALPDYVTNKNYEIEERTLYRSRKLETTSSTTSDKMDGWELYETAEGNGDYGAWSDWSATAVSASDTRDVETQTRYRYSDKETTTGSSSSMSGWTLEDTTYSWGNYGSWSQWSTDKATLSDSRDVQAETRYRYRDKETTTSSSSSMSGWTLDNTTYNWGDYGSWSQWSTDKVSSSDSREVQTETRYRYRDKETTTSYNSSLSGWTLASSEWVVNDYGTIRYVASWPAGFNRNHSLFSEYNNTPVSASESNTVKTVINSTGTEGYIYYHWCRGTYTSGPINRKTSEVQTSEFNCFHAFYSTSSAPRYDPNGADGQNSRYYPNASVCRDSYWYYPITVNYQNYTTYNKLFYYERWKDWSSWSTTAVSGNSSREVQVKTYYRYRDRAKIPTYHFSRWKDWSSWSTTEVSGNSNREVKKTTFYRYRDREKIPAYHFSRWKDWSSWSETEYKQTADKKVESTTFYRYRDRVQETTYYFRRWTEWSDYLESPVAESETIEVQTKKQYRYKSNNTK